MDVQTTRLIVQVPFEDTTPFNVARPTTGQICRLALLLSCVIGRRCQIKLGERVRRIRTKTVLNFQ